MGKTRRTYRNIVEKEKEEMEDFQRLLRELYQPDYKRLWEHASQHAQPMDFRNPTDPWQGILFCICLHQEHLIRQLEIRCSRLEDELLMDSEVTKEELHADAA